jgi:Domain of unknown function (DUF4224)
MRNGPPPLFLTDSELEYMSGYKQPAAQIRWLQKWRVRHLVNALGHPRVTRSAVEGTTKIESEKPRTEPNWAALDDWKTGTHWRQKRRRQGMRCPAVPPFPHIQRLPVTIMAVRKTQ